MISFQRPAPDGWRYAPGWRTRRFEGGFNPGWATQRWNGERWVTTASGLTYPEARREPDRERV